MFGTQEQTVWPTSLTALRGTVCWACCAGPSNSALSSPSVPPWLRACKMSSPGMTYTTRPQYGGGPAGMYGLLAGGEWPLRFDLVIASTTSLRGVVAEKKGSVKTDRCYSSSWQGNAISWCPWLDGTFAAWAHTESVMAFLFLLTVLATQTPLTWCEWQRSSERKASRRTDSMKMTLPRLCRTFWVSLRWTWLGSKLCSETARPLEDGWRWGPQQTGV